MNRYSTLLITGCGGVGANVAVLAARAKLFDRMVLVDDDVVEAKNLERQPFFEEDVGKPKVEALKGILNRIDSSLRVEAFKERVESPMDTVFLQGFGQIPYSILLVATDSVASKRMIFSELRVFFSAGFLVNCEKEFYEIKNKLDEEELKAWRIGDGYSSTQTWASNIVASTRLVGIWASLGCFPELRKTV